MSFAKNHFQKKHKKTKKHFDDDEGPVKPEQKKRRPLNDHNLVKKWMELEDPEDDLFVS